MPHTLGQLTCEQTALLARELGLEIVELGVGVEPVHDGKAVLSEEALDRDDVVGRKLVDLVCE